MSNIETLLRQERKNKRYPHSFIVEDYAKARFEVLRDFFLRDSNHAKTWDELSDTQKSFFIRTQAPGSEQPGEFMTVPLAYQPPESIIPTPLSYYKHAHLVCSVLVGFGLALMTIGLLLQR